MRHLRRPPVLRAKGQSLDDEQEKGYPARLSRRKKPASGSTIGDYGIAARSRAFRFAEFSRNLTR
jgi:hypothetical protein